MKFYIKKKKIFKLLSKLNNYVGNSLKNPIINNVLIELNKKVLVLIVTNLEIEIRYNILMTKKDILECGIITVSIRKLYELFYTYLKNEKILFYLYKKRLKISYLNSISYLSTLESSYFPIFNKKIFIKNKFSISNILLKNIIKLTYFSIGDQNVYHYLNGMLIEFVNDIFFFVTTDGYRISIYKLNLGFLNYKKKKKFFFIISKKLVLELLKLLDFLENTDVIFEINENIIKIIFGNFIIYSSLVNGNFPDYKNILFVVKNYNFVDINIIDLKNVLLRSSAVSGCCLNYVTFTFSNNFLFVFSSDSNNNEINERIIINNFNKINLKISFNIKYILDIINCIKDTYEVRFFLKDYNSIVKIVDINNKYINYMVMPVVL